MVTSLKVFLVCPRSYDKVRSDCKNNTECKMILDEYNNECDGIIHWDGNSTMPMCTDKCKKLIEKLESNSIGKYLKCCNCDNENKAERTQCVREKENIAVICDVDFNHVRHCHNDQKLCVNDINTSPKDNAGNKDCSKVFSFIVVYLYYCCLIDYLLLTCFGWKQKCIDDKCCRKAFNDVLYYCKDVREWRE